MAPLATTTELAAAVRRGVPRRGWQRIDPATRTFQAIRIWVNQELDGVDKFLRDAVGRLRAGSRLVVLTFHSLEDRLVKRAFRDEARVCRLEVITRRPARPTDEEVRANPRARSARLRVARRPCPEAQS